MGEEDPVKADSGKLDTELQMLLLGTDTVGGEQQHVADAENRLGIAAAIRLKAVQRPHILNAEQVAVTEQKVTADVRLRLRTVFVIIAGECRAERLDLIAADRETRGQRVAAEALQIPATGGERLIEIEASAAAAGALAVFTEKTDHHRRQAILHRQTGSRDAEDTLMPAFGGEDDGAFGQLRTELLLGIAPDVVFNLLALPGQLAEFRREAGGFRKEYDGAQDYDLILRCVHWCREHYDAKEWMKYIRHVPKIVYHWRTHPASTAGDTSAKEYAYQAGLRAAQAALKAEGIDVPVVHLKHLGFYRADYPEDIFTVRSDLGAVGGPVYKHDEIVSGLMNAKGDVVFKELPRGFSGNVHIAALQQSAEAVDLRNMRIREDLIPLFEKTTGLKWPLEEEPDAEQAKSKSLRFCTKLREKGIGILYDPQQEKETTE